MIYLAAFVTSALLLHQSLWGSKARRVACYWGSIIVLVLLAAFRSNDVGIDVSVYAVPFANEAMKTPLNVFMTNMSLRGIEVGYTWLTFIGANYLGGIPGVLGIIHAIILVFAFARLRDFKSIAPVWLMTLIYLLMFYNQSLNLMRQSIAMSIVFWCSRYLEKCKWKYVVYLGVAILFHNSAILGVVLLVMDIAAKGNMSKLKTLGVMLCMLVFIAFFDKLMYLAISVLPIDGERYFTYLSSSSGYLNATHLLFRVLFVVIAFLCGRVLANVYVMSGVKRKASYLYMKQDKAVYRYYMLIMIFSLGLCILTVYDGDCYRFAMYFTMFVPVIVPQLRRLLSKRSRRTVDFALLLLFLVYWALLFVLNNEGGTWPYQFGTN